MSNGLAVSSQALCYSLRSDVRLLPPDCLTRSYLSFVHRSVLSSFVILRNNTKNMCHMIFALIYSESADPITPVYYMFSYVSCTILKFVYFLNIDKKDIYQMFLTVSYSESAYHTYQLGVDSIFDHDYYFEKAFID